MARPVTQDSDKAQYNDILDRLDRLERAAFSTPGAHAYKSTTTALSASISAVATWDGTRWADGGVITLPDSKLYATIDGRYLVGGMGSFPAGIGGTQAVIITLNGTTTLAYQVANNPASTIGNVKNVNVPVFMKAGDYVTVSFYSTVATTVAASNSGTTQYAAEGWIQRIA